MNGKYLADIKDCKLQLNNIKKWIDDNKLHSNVRYLICYAVIKACGTTEVIFKGIIFDHLSKGANEETKEYLTRNILESSSNPKPNNIERLLKSINSDWQKQFSKKINKTNAEADLKSLVQLRNEFSHGNNITSSIEDIIRYFDGAEKILIELDVIVGNGES